MRTLENLNLRELQILSARVLAVIEATNNTLWKFNKQAFHDSQNWYRTVIQWYIDEYGGWPDEVGPGKNVELLYDE